MGIDRTGSKVFCVTGSLGFEDVLIFRVGELAFHETCV